MTQFTVSVNFRDTDVFASQDGTILWKSTSSQGAIDWILTLMDHLRNKHNLLIGRHSAEFAFLDLGSALPMDEERTRIIRGRNLLTHLPGSLEISSVEIRDCCGFSYWISQLSRIFHTPESDYVVSYWPTPVPDALKPSLLEHPIILTGEFGTLKGLREALEEGLNLPVVLGDDAGIRPGLQIGGITG